MPNFLANPFRNLVPLFTDAGWSRHGNATPSADGQMLTLVATATYQNTQYYASLMPNTVYEIEFPSGSGYVGVFNEAGTVAILQYSNANGKRQFNSGRETKVRVVCSNYSNTAGTFTFGAIKLTKVQPLAAFSGNPYANLVPLFSDAAWTRHANATVSPDGKTLTLAATGGGQISYVDIPVTPLTRYTYVVDVATTGALAYVGADEYAGATKTATQAQSVGAGRATITVTTRADTTKLRVFVNCNASGVFTFSNLSLTRVQPAVGAFSNPYRELVTNGDFAQGATGWSVAQPALWAFANGIATLTPDVTFRNISQVLTVTPLTEYEVNFTGTGFYSVTESDNSVTYLSYGQGKRTFRTGPRTTSLRLYLGNGGQMPGPYTFDAVSLKRKQS